MKQIWPNYSYSPTTNVLTLTGLNIDRDQLLLVSAPERGRIMYNFADSTVTASAFTAGANTGLTLVASTAGLTTTAALVIYYDDQLASTTVTVSSLPAISGTVTANVFGKDSNAEGLTAQIPIISYDEGIDNAGISYVVPVQVTNLGGQISEANPLPISGTVTIGAGTAQIGSVTVGNSVTIGSLPAISGTVTANLSISSTAITSGSFASLTSATLVPANTARKMATVYNLGSGQLFVNQGASATTLGGGFMVALSSGDYFECPFTTTTLSAIFATAGTASWVSH